MAHLAEQFTREVRDRMFALRAIIKQTITRDMVICMSFEEFTHILPDTMREANGVDELYAWFRLADSDGNGTVELGELFVWSCAVATAKCGGNLMSMHPPIVQVFRKFDKDRSGRLDELEFIKAAREMGLGDLAETLFTHLDEMDHRPDGMVDFKNLTQKVAVMSRTNAMRTLTKAFLDDQARHPRKLVVLDTSAWAFTGKDAEEARVQLKALLEREAITLTQIFRTMDRDGNGYLTQSEFKEMFEDFLGFKGLPVVTMSIFSDIDFDRSGSVGFTELDEWLIKGSGFHRAAALKQKLSLKKRFLSDDEPWNERRLRQEIQTIVREIGMSVTDLIRAWDRSNNDQLEKKELLIHIKGMVGSDDLWYSHVRGAVIEAFTVMDWSQSGSVDVKELNGWLTYEGTNAYPMPHRLFSRAKSAKVAAPAPAPATLELEAMATPKSPRSRARRPGEMPPSLNNSPMLTVRQAAIVAQTPTVLRRQLRPQPRHCSKYAPWLDEVLREGHAAAWLARARPQSPTSPDHGSPSWARLGSAALAAHSWRAPPAKAHGTSCSNGAPSLMAAARRPPPLTPRAPSDGISPRRAAPSPRPSPVPSAAWCDEVVAEHLARAAAGQHGRGRRSVELYAWSGKLNSWRAKQALQGGAPLRSAY